MGWNPIGDMKKLFGKFKKEVSGGINKIRDGVNRGVHEVESVAHKAESEVKGVVSKGKNEVQGLLDKGKHEFEELADKAKDELEELAEKAKGTALATLHSIENAAAQEGVKFVLEKLLAASHLAPKGAYFRGQAIVGLDFQFDIQAVLDDVRKWVKKPPSSTDDLKQFLIDLAPTQVTVFVGGEVPVIGNISVEGGLFWEKDYVVQNWNEIKKLVAA